MYWKPFWLVCLLSLGSLVTVEAATAGPWTNAISVTREYRGDPAQPALQAHESLQRVPMVLSGPRRESHVFASGIGARSGIASYPCPVAPRLGQVAVSLDDDTDRDGYFSFFSLRFVPRGYCQHRYVFARLFLSYEGGPWNLLYRTHAWEGGSGADPIMLDTRLQQNYPTGFYDLLIELYDAADGRWLLSEGPYETAALRSLPLEAESLDVFDTGPRLGYVFYGTGAIGVEWLMLLLTVIWRRLANRRRFRRNAVFLG